MSRYGRARKPKVCFTPSYTSIEFFPLPLTAVKQWKLLLCISYEFRCSHLIYKTARYDSTLSPSTFQVNEFHAEQRRGLRCKHRSFPIPSLADLSNAYTFVNEAACCDSTLPPSPFYADVSCVENRLVLRCKQMSSPVACMLKHFQRPYLF